MKNTSGEKLPPKLNSDGRPPNKVLPVDFRYSATILCPFCKTRVPRRSIGYGGRCSNC